MLYKGDMFWLILCEGVRYNEEKEEQAQWSAKVKELERIEEAKKKSEEKSEFAFTCFSLLYYVLFFIFSFVLYYLMDLTG